MYRKFIFIFCCLVFVSGALLPGEERNLIKAWFSIGDFETSAHFILSFGITIIGLMFSGGRSVVIFFVAGLGGVLELLQLVIPGRSASLSDFLIDVAGVALGCILYVLLRRLLRTDQSVIR